MQPKHKINKAMVSRTPIAELPSIDEFIVEPDLPSVAEFLEEEKKTCPEGEYFCNDEQKCKPIPAGHKVLEDGELVKEEFIMMLMVILR